MSGFVPWVGGKSRLAASIISKMPSHKSYIEVFGGGGWVLFNKPKIKTEVYNDINGDLVNLFRVVRDHDLQFERRQHFLLASREEYTAFREAWRTCKPKDDIDRAIMFYYLLKNSFGANVTSGWGYGRQDRPRYPTCLESLPVIRERLKGVYIENNSFERCIKIWDHPNALFYLDPPYMDTEFYYKKGSGKFDMEEHEKLRDMLKSLKGRFILSYEDHPVIRRLYKGFKVKDLKVVKRSLNNVGEVQKEAMEILIMNCDCTG
jgi:DNA adenine methylase